VAPSTSAAHPVARASAAGSWVSRPLSLSSSSSSPGGS
jgi:hypothetical protein